MMKNFYILRFLLILIFSVVSFRLSATELVVNGNFSTGDLTGWSLYKEFYSTGTWLVYSGNKLPLSGTTFTSPPSGAYAAAVDNDGETYGFNTILYQDVTLPAGSHPTLSFISYYTNGYVDFFAPDSLNYKIFVTAQVRVDIVSPLTDLVSILPADILLNVLHTEKGSPRVMRPRVITADLSAFAGQTIRLRFSASLSYDIVPNLYWGIDQVSITVN